MRDWLLREPGDAGFPTSVPQFSSSSMLMASERISLTSTLNDSGMQATISCSPSTMFLYIRSEEHKSELQSLMRISYAVLCLNKKIKQPVYNTMTPYNN